MGSKEGVISKEYIIRSLLRWIKIVILGSSDMLSIIHICVSEMVNLEVAVFRFVEGD